MNKNYNASNYKILAGHSVGGIFIVNAAITRPDLFNDYIAISPALWWANNAMQDVMDATWGKTKSTSASLYISLANEEGMGVDEFLKKLPNSIMEKNVHFKEFPNEIHNSVGLPTYKWALTDIFSNWYVKEEYFPTAEDLERHYSKVKKQYGSIFNIPYTVLGNTYYMLKKKDKELEKIEAVLKELHPDALVSFNTYRADKLLADKKFKQAEALLNEALAINPKAFDSYNVLAKIKLEEGNTADAKINIDKAINLAKSQNARQWKINELLETKKMVDVQ